MVESLNIDFRDFKKIYTILAQLFVSKIGELAQVWFHSNKLVPSSSDRPRLGTTCVGRPHSPGHPFGSPFGII